MILKKDKALQELKKWRSITLLNCDYKIACKAIASSLKAVLQNLVDNDQTGFLKGRSIAENICLINNVISFTESKNISGLRLFVDFEKAFDTIEWAFVEKTLHHFGFGSSLIKRINFPSVNSSIAHAPRANHRALASFKKMGKFPGVGTHKVV